MREYKKPDLNAPRFRKKSLSILNEDFCKKLRAEHPECKDLTSAQIKDVVRSFNGKIWESVIENRDGVELLEQLGYLFIGTCKRKIKPNPDRTKSLYYGVEVQHQNWESDQYLAKIFYTNFETKYRFKFHELWGFTALRDFKRTVAKTYPKEWKKYVVVDNLTKVSKLFRKHVYKDILQNEKEEILKTYDEFDMT